MGQLATYSEHLSREPSLPQNSKGRNRSDEFACPLLMDIIIVILPWCGTIAGMLLRKLTPYLEGLLDRHPAVGLLGPRRVAKTTLALELARNRLRIWSNFPSRNSFFPGTVTSW